jgi:glutamyl-tRNA synthetase
MTVTGVGNGARVGVVETVERTERKRDVVIPTTRPLTTEEIYAMGGGQAEEPRRVRVRFAPSPTGHLHIGGARTALVNYMFAKANGGDFIVRIEDTDQMRSKPEFTEAIFDGLKWLGLPWDEEVVYQSQRTELYQRKVEQLLASGKARVDADTGAVYFIMPKEGKLVIEDRLKGRVEVDPEPDFVIQRSDGSPMFLLANVVDDGEQQITHIFRGHEHLVNAAKQIELFKALGYRVPEFYHMPLINGDPVPHPEDPTKVKARGKLSKRHGATSVIDFQTKGFSPKVLLNHLARLGIGFDDRTTMSLEELTQRFDPTRLSKRTTVLGLNECVKTGGKYEVRPGPLMERMFIEIMQTPTEELVDEIEKFFPGHSLDREQLIALADGGKRRFSTFVDFVDFVAFLRTTPEFKQEDIALHAPKKAVVRRLVAQLEGVADWTLARLEAELEKFNQTKATGYSAYSNTMRWMLTGKSDGFPLHHTMVLLGREESLARLRRMTA